MPRTREQTTRPDPEDETFQPVTEVARLDLLKPRPCQRCGYDTANDPDKPRRR